MDIFYKIKSIFHSNKKTYNVDQLEKILLSADFGTDITIKIANYVEEKIGNKKITIEKMKEFLLFYIQKLYNYKNSNIIEDIKNNIPYVIMIVGINGVGKTTTIGKLAFLFKKNGYNSIISASDTFRAAAIEQLEIWAKRSGSTLIKQHTNADPASVAYDTTSSAISKNKDVVLIDTAGRLHNRIDLMNELAKIKRVLRKIKPFFPQEIILILDANSGQNTIKQTKEFINCIGISSIILTKMDGTAKGGFIMNIIDKFHIPIKYIGIGEKIEDIQMFNYKKFINTLFI